jgi:glycosyltransferase involved in cell wall biosynthesis
LSAGCSITVRPFLTEKAYLTIYQSGNFFTKTVVLFTSYLKRIFVLRQIIRHDLIFIHREAMPAGPPFVEWLTYILGKPIVYDFDDAIWLTDKIVENPFVKFLKWRGKIKSICAWSYTVSCGNKYLAAYAQQFNKKVVINPTTIDVEHVHKPSIKIKEFHSSLTIGWTGSSTTLKYLKTIEKPLREILAKFPNTKLLIIADRRPQLNFPFTFCQWSAASEIQDLQRIDIGIMPMPDDDWTRGKCGFKALQYMAMEIPAVVSPVGVNVEIVSHGIEGYHCTTEDEWFAYLAELIQDSGRRMEMGKLGRKKVIEHYSVASNTSNFLSLFQ